MISSRKISPVAKLFHITFNGSRRRFLMAAAFVFMLALGATATIRFAGSSRQTVAPKSPSAMPVAAHAHYLTPAASAMFDVSANPVSTVSAAAFEQVPVAPDSIVTAFGSPLASSVIVAGDAEPNTPGIQLPTDLGGTSVEVNGRKAGLFFVSPFQINYLMPAATETGLATVVVKFGQTISNGTVMIARVAPGIFAANSNGRGVPAATILRVKPDGSQRYEALSQYNQQEQKYITKPINVPETDVVVLVLFLTGIRKATDINGDGNLNESIRVLIGGVEATVIGAVPQPDFVGLDQVNAIIPSSLAGRGQVDVTVIGTGYTASNIVRLEIAGTGGAQPPSINGFGSVNTLAGTELIINGQGFSSVKEDNVVRINGLDVPDVMEASTTQLKVLVPFNVESGTVTVRTPQGEGQSISTLQVRTSISGFVENTNGQPLSNVPVRISNSAISTVTNATGSFVLPDVPPGAHFVEFDGTALQTTVTYPKYTRKLTAIANRDTQVSGNISLQAETGGSGVIGGGSFGEDETNGSSFQSPAQPSPQPLTIETGEYQVVVPPGTKVKGPNGETSMRLILTPLKNARTPVELPFGYFSPSIVQLTPFNYQFDPGVQLIFPNTDGFPANTALTLFYFDNELGKFVEEKAGAKVSADGKRVETGANIVKVSSYYFAAQYADTTTIAGRVLNSDRKPVAKTVVRCKGQVATTDGNGSYLLRYVPAKEGEILTVEGAAVLANLNVLRTPNVSAPAVPGGITKMPDLFLPKESDNRPPDIDAPEKIEAIAGKALELVITIKDPDPGQIVAEASVSGASFVTLVKRITGINPNTYSLNLAPTPTQIGTYNVVIKANDNLGLGARANIVVVVTVPK